MRGCDVRGRRREGKRQGRGRVRHRALVRGESRSIPTVVRDDAGSILPLTVFYAGLALLLVLVVIAITSAYLERKKLFTLADGAALVGAEAFDLRDVDVTSGHPEPVLRSDAVRDAVDAYVADNDRGDLESVHVELAGTTDGHSAVVQLSSYWRPPVVTFLYPEGIRLTVTTTARSVFD